MNNTEREELKYEIKKEVLLELMDLLDIDSRIINQKIRKLTDEIMRDTMNNIEF